MEFDEWKKMRCWDHKALPTHGGSIHLTIEPVDSKMLAVGVSRLHGSHLPCSWPLPYTSRFQTLCLPVAGQSKGCPRTGLADGRAQGQGPGESRKITALTSPAETQKPEPLPLAMRNLSGCIVGVVYYFRKPQTKTQVQVVYLGGVISWLMSLP